MWFDIHRFNGFIIIPFSRYLDVSVAVDAIDIVDVFVIFDKNIKSKTLSTNQPFTFSANSAESTKKTPKMKSQNSFKKKAAGSRDKITFHESQGYTGNAENTEVSYPGTRTTNKCLNSGK